MVRCWSYDAENRPTFFYCLNALKELRDKLVSSAVIMPSVYNFNYLGETNLGTYIGQNDYQENSENKLQDQNLDSRSTQSDPATPSEMAEANVVCLRRSSSWSSAMFDVPSSSLSAVVRATNTPTKRIVNKYLELLGDNEDSDGYQLPLQFHASSRRSRQGNESRPGNNLTIAGNSFAEQFGQSMSLNAVTNELSNGSFTAENFHVSPATNEQNLLEATHDITSESESFPSWLEDCDNWSVSTASTATFHFDSSNPRNSGISTLSCISGIDLKYASKSSIC